MRDRAGRSAHIRNVQRRRAAWGSAHPWVAPDPLEPPSGCRLAACLRGGLAARRATCSCRSGRAAGGRRGSPLPSFVPPVPAVVPPRRAAARRAPRPGDAAGSGDARFRGRTGDAQRRHHDEKENDGTRSRVSRGPHELIKGRRTALCVQRGAIAGPCTTSDRRIPVSSMITCNVRSLALALACCVRCRLRAVLGRDAGRDGRLGRLAAHRGDGRDRDGDGRDRTAATATVASRQPAALRPAARAIRSAPVARKRSTRARAARPARVARRAARAAPQGRPVGAGPLEPAERRRDPDRDLPAGALFCEDFETFAAMAPPNGKWTARTNGTATVIVDDDARAQRNQGRSLSQLAREQRPARLHSHARRARFPRSRASTLYVRFMMYIGRVHVGRGHEHSQPDRLGRRRVHPGVWRKRPGLCFRHVQRHRRRTPHESQPGLPARHGPAPRRCVAQGKWQCFEFEIDNKGGVPAGEQSSSTTMPHIWQEGTELKLAAGGARSRGCRRPSRRCNSRCGVRRRTRCRPTTGSTTSSCPRSESVARPGNDGSGRGGVPEAAPSE